MKPLYINWIAIAIAFLISVIWTLFAFGRITMPVWEPMMKKANRKPINLKERPQALPLMIVGMFISTFVIYLVIYYIGADSWWIGLLAGAMIWIGFGAIFTFFLTAIASLPFGLWVYNAIAQLMLFSGLGLLFAVWR
jgi:hypothetical protein